MFLKDRTTEVLTGPSSSSSRFANRDVDSFLESVARAPRSLLMLDFDGTLAPFHNLRDKVLPYPGVTSVLQKIIAAGRTRVVIVSGRDATELIPLLALDPHPEVWGLHGLQRLMDDGSIAVSELEESTLRALVLADDWLVTQQLETAAEFKAGSIAVHWRGLDQAKANDIHRRTMQGWTGIAREYGLDLLQFDGGVEIRSKKANKGAAVRTLLSEMKLDTPAAYLGDDTTDEEAFEAIRGAGLSVLVRPMWRATAAQIWLKPPGELLSLLTKWLKVCKGWDESRDEIFLET
jgi:trehalose 6-phosphate phosphatase